MLKLDSSSSCLDVAVYTSGVVVLKFSNNTLSGRDILLFEVMSQKHYTPSVARQWWEYSSKSTNCKLFKITKHSEWAPITCTAVNFDPFVQFICKQNLHWSASRHATWSLSGLVAWDYCVLSTVHRFPLICPRDWHRYGDMGRRVLGNHLVCSLKAHLVHAALSVTDRQTTASDNTVYSNFQEKIIQLNIYLLIIYSG